MDSIGVTIFLNLALICTCAPDKDHPSTNCFLCSSRDNQDCGFPFKQNRSTLVKCAHWGKIEDVRRVLDRPKCFKEEYKESGMSVYERGCTYLQGICNSSAALRGNSFVFCEVCDWDECNDGTRLTLGPASGVRGVVCGLAVWCCVWLLAK